MKSISLNELEAIFSLVLDKLKFEEAVEIDIDVDYYRFIPASYWKDNTSSEVYSGSMADDISNLKLLVSDRNRPCTYVDFDRLASVLHAISEKYNPS